MNDQNNNEEIKEFRFTLAKMYEIIKVDEMVAFINEVLKNKEDCELVGFGSAFRNYYVKFKVKKKPQDTQLTANNIKENNKV